MTDDLTPEQCERRLRGLVNTLAKAQADLRAARDREVDAKHTYQAAHRRAILSKDCPRVARGGVTTAERDAWVDDQASTEQRVHDIAEATRKAAEDHLRTVRDQAMIVMALNRSVQTAYSLAGVAG